MNKNNLANAVFGNLFLIALVAIGFYIFFSFKELSKRVEAMKKQFEKVLDKYITEKIKKAKETADSILKTYGREDAVSTEITRLLLTIEKGESGNLNDKVDTCNALNKFKLNEQVDLERYPELAKLNDLRVFTEEELNQMDNGLALARREYNAQAFLYNAKAGGFPIQYLTKLFGFKGYYKIFETQSFENYSDNYEVFEEVEQEEDLMANLNQKTKKEEEKKEEFNANNEKIEDIVIEHTDTVFKPSVDLTSLNNRK